MEIKLQIKMNKKRFLRKQGQTERGKKCWAWHSLIHGIGFESFKLQLDGEFEPSDYRSIKSE